MRQVVRFDPEEQARLLDLDWELEQDADWAFVQARATPEDEQKA